MHRCRRRKAPTMETTKPAEAGLEGVAHVTDRLERRHHLDALVLV